MTLKLIYGLRMELGSMMAKDRRCRPCKRGKRVKKPAKEEYISLETMIKQKQGNTHLIASAAVVS